MKNNNQWWIDVIRKQLPDIFVEYEQEKVEHIIKVILEHERKSISQWIDRRN